MRPHRRGRPYHSRLAELCRRAGVETSCTWNPERGRLDLAALGKRQHTRCGSAAPNPWPQTLDAHLAAPLHRELFRFR